MTLRCTPSRTQQLAALPSTWTLLLARLHAGKQVAAEFQAVYCRKATRQDGLKPCAFAWTSDVPGACNMVPGAWNPPGAGGCAGNTSIGCPVTASVLTDTCLNIASAPRSCRAAAWLPRSGPVSMWWSDVAACSARAISLQHIP